MGQIRMDIIYTLPFFIREEHPCREQDLKLAENCLSSLQQSGNTVIVIYNQGCLKEDNLRDFLSFFKIYPIILGDGHNVGIARARQICFEYIWQNYPEVPFIAEIHLDMIFPPNWHRPLLDFLNSSDEPMICPGIVTSGGELHPINKGVSMVKVPQEYTDLVFMLKQLVRDEFHEGFVHPVIHKSRILKEIGGYDYRFLKGKQGYEDDSLLLGYLYHMGTRTNWKPKACLKSWVYHAAMAQRIALPGKEQEFALNLRGLFYQYGGYGFKQLARIHNNDSYFAALFESILQEL